ncbi:hypothetical protein Tco_0238370 [Tanacetum coccineum]
MSLANQKATTEYQEAIQATEDLESPAVGFAKTSDYKGVELEEKFDKLKQEIHTIKEKEVQPAELEDSISSLAKRLDSFSISGKLPKFRLQAYPRCGNSWIRLHALHRRSAGTNALVVLRDTRWEDSRQIIATMEVDLSAGTQLVYTFPDMILSRLSNTSYMGFQYSVENVVDHLTTTGITAIPGERRSIEELEGMSWHLKPPEQTSVRVPSRVAVNERLNRSVSLRFERYRQTPQPPRYSVDQHDREVIGNDNLDEDEEHFIGICSQAPQEEHISYDVCFCESCLNEARILEEEPLNKVRRSNKPKRSKQKSSEKWSTLGEPSGKWDYYVRYDAPPDITPIEEVAATGWGDEFSDDEDNEVTPGKVTILEERSDWDDDERNDGKYRYNRKGFLEDDESSDDSILIVDPGWDDYSLQALKSNRPISLCPEARRARM